MNIDKLLESEEVQQQIVCMAGIIAEAVLAQALQMTSSANEMMEKINNEAIIKSATESRQNSH